MPRIGVDPAARSDHAPGAGAAAETRRLISETVVVAVGMVVFALFAHRGVPWTVLSGAGLLTAALVIGVSLRRVAHPRELLGISGAGSRLGAAVVLGIGSGVAAGFWQRGQASVPHEAATGLPLFVLLACLIGIAEELVYRGWMQGRLSSLGWPAVVVAAVAHAAYKTALFAWPPEAVTSVFDLGSIALWTVLGGLMLGGLRVMSGSVLPAMLAHAVFDAVVYSGYAAAPWWVWR